MSGRRIDDRSSWISKDGTFPEGAKMKTISNVEGAGYPSRYEDTEERIAEMQRKNVSQAKKYDMKEGYRN